MAKPARLPEIPAHFDGERIVLDADGKLPIGARLRLTVLMPQEPEVPAASTHPGRGLEMASRLLGEAADPKASVASAVLDDRSAYCRDEA